MDDTPKSSANTTTTSTTTKCLLKYNNNRNFLTLSKNQLKISRLNPPLFGEKEFTILIDDIVAVKGADNESFQIFAVPEVPGGGGARTIKSYYFSLSPRHKDEPLADLHAQLVQAVPRLKNDKKLLVLINPFGGTKAAPALWVTVSPLFDVAEVAFEVVTTKTAGHGYKLASELPLDQYRGIVCVSGDGLLSEILNGVLSRTDALDAIQQLTFGIIPGGSGNGLAACLGASDPITAAFHVIKGDKIAMDVFSNIQGSKRTFAFLSVSWATLSVIDLQSEGYRWLGDLRFDVKGVVEVLSCDNYQGKISYVEAKPEEIKVSYDQEEIKPDSLQLKFCTDSEDNSGWKTLEGDWSFYLVTNGPKITQGSKKGLSPQTNLSDGCLDLIIAPSMSRVDLAQILMGIDEGGITKHEKVQHKLIKAFYLEPVPGKGKPIAPIAIDGEHTDNSPIKGEVHPRLMKIFANRKIL